MLVRSLSISGYGCVISISTVKSSTLRTALKAGRLPLSGEASSDTRVIEATTSSAVNGAPLWNFTPWRSLKRSTGGDVASQDSASAGVMLNLSS
ncbi:hypothetical protein G6F62_015856 [Rhizopus arrhizus]|nr:hypothetical protein G6F62_015856 [Rhizopus arrhizus]